jgi:hypothetical protein
MGIFFGCSKPVVRAIQELGHRAVAFHVSSLHQGRWWPWNIPRIGWGGAHPAAALASAGFVHVYVRTLEGRDARPAGRVGRRAVLSLSRSRRLGQWAVARV